MTIAARKQREKEDMRQLILDGARKIFLEKGYALTSIRNIAELIEYSPGTIYLYFKDKDEIFHSLHEEGFRRMLEKMQPLQHVGDPMERLKAMGRVYLDFAQHNRDFYELMFILKAPMDHEDHDEWQMGDNTLNFLKSIVRECQQKGHFAGKDVNFLSFTIWSMVHGMAALFCSDRCKAYHNEGLEPDALIAFGYQNFVEMLERC